MLKFQDNYNTTIKNFEDFILIVFVIIDDLYKQYAPMSVTDRRNIYTAKLTDSEVIAICICGELLGIDSEKAWFSYVKRNYSHLFPQLGDRSRFNRRRKDLLQVTELLRQKLFTSFFAPTNNYFIIDSFPLPVCKFGRARYSKAFRYDGANYGKCPSKKETYYGYKVHVLVTLEGYITMFEITPASVDDREGLRDIAADLSNFAVLGDKGYCGQSFTEEMAEQHVQLMSLKPSNSKNNWSKSIRQLIFKLRRRIETVFSQLTEQLNAERVLAKSFRGLCTRIQNKILAYNLCMVINRLLYKNTDVGKIKHLIF